MNKVELISAMADKAEMSKKDAGKALTAFTNVVVDALVDGDKVSITGFGVFEVTERAERMGRNPSTNEPMLIKASKAPKFKVSKNLKGIINA